MSNDYMRLESSNNYNSKMSKNTGNYKDPNQRNNNYQRNNYGDAIASDDEEEQEGQGRSNSNSDSSKSDSVVQIEKDNGYSVSDGRSDDSLVFSEDGGDNDGNDHTEIGEPSKENNINYKRYLSKQRFLNGQ